MTLLLTEADYDELCQSSSGSPLSSCSSEDDYEASRWLPMSLGRGRTRCLELSPGVWLDLIDKEFAQPWALRVPEHDHLVQFTIMLSGVVDYDEVYPTLGEGVGYLSGSGLSHGYVARYGRSRHIRGINIHLRPDVVESFLTGQSSTLRQSLLKTNDWKTAWFPPVTPGMRIVAQQMLHCPFYGAARRLYLQAKVFELLAVQIDALQADQGEKAPTLALKPSTVDGIYQARAILTAQLENPPSVTELAQQVGLCDRTLRRGFRDRFGTTIIGYLTQQRMVKAEQLLQQGDYTVAEVANKVGYTHLGHFAAAFRKQFGVSPKECLAGKSVFGSF
ncbi:AraC family transcriptional regulator [filamentous cyanobacterium CCT1]|nr:AraC family transcriptional regulator [filamentous cyanobacterium CCT1]PSN78919.1 AraC family transcriptional regulator [filamentous cyanobacterium CCP4]